MLSGTCAFCGNQTHFTARSGRVSDREPLPSGGSVYQFEVAATCDACHRFNTAFGRTAGTGNRYEDGSILNSAHLTSEAEAMTIEQWSPPAMRPVDVSFIPPGVAGFFKEAHDAVSIGATRAALLLIRSVVEATAKDKGVKTGSLYDKIDALASQGFIREGVKDMAHALRVLGNDMAHGDIDHVPNAEDAEDALRIARFVLDDVYVADAVRVDMLKRRQVKKQATG